MDTWKQHPLWLRKLAPQLPGGLKTPYDTAVSEIREFGKLHPSSPVILPETDASSGDGYTITAGDGEIVIRGGEAGILYGTYAVLLGLATGKEVRPGTVKPALTMRILNSWDNTDGSIERGYSGNSIWFEHGRFSYETGRILQLGRFLASAGINVLCINNVNVRDEARFLPGRYLEKTAEFAALLRPFGVRLMLSVDFSLPLACGVPTADPLCEEVRSFWKNTASGIWDLIPDFAGFLVKADSEHRPGPNTYGRTHAEGANMLADAVREYGGVVVWRAFVYNCMQDWRDAGTDRPCAAYEIYRGLDGTFSKNVILQVKNGPYDFQVREPVSPLFFAMPGTKLSMELQITQEYTGQQIDLFTMPHYWSGIFAAVPEGSLCAAAGVSNLGNDPNWTGHPFASLNLFAFGRMAWDPHADPDELITEWIRLSYELPLQEEKILAEILRMSPDAYEKYTSPLGLGWMVVPGSHYGPSPYGYEFSPWGTYIRAGRDAVGIDRTERGTGFVGQYPPDLRRVYGDTALCPDKLLLFFHRLPYDFVMSDGRTLIQRIYDDHFEGYNMVLTMQEKLTELVSLPEEDRRIAEKRMEMQRLNAGEWRDVINTFFYRLSGIRDLRGRKIYE